MKSDVLNVIEAAYRVDSPTPAWLHDVGTSFYAQLGAGVGLYGCEYRVRDDGMLEVGEELRVDMPAMAARLPIRDALQMLPPAFTKKTFARCDCATQSQIVDAELAPFAEGMSAQLAQFGWHDILAFSGVDPAGHGVFFNAFLPEKRSLSPKLRARWQRTSVHLAAALRLRRRLADLATAAADSADAVVTPNGRIDHANGAAQLRDAQAALRAAVRDVERARGQLRRRDPDAAVASWKGLVATRWSLVDHFESDGKRYVLAHRNEVRLNGLAALTARERQALGYAALGHTNKLIAYELGVTSSTVAVLLHRCARKLGTSTRAELLDVYAQLAKQ